MTVGRFRAPQVTFFESEQRRWQQVLTGRLWSPEKNFFMNLATPPPRSLHEEIRTYQRMRRGREVPCPSAITYVPQNAASRVHPPREVACHPPRGSRVPPPT